MESIAAAAVIVAVIATEVVDPIEAGLVAFAAVAADQIAADAVVVVAFAILAVRVHNPHPEVDVVAAVAVGTFVASDGMVVAATGVAFAVAVTVVVVVDEEATVFEIHSLEFQ
jgi:hypothetical protein